jgi:replicative superfamily II helicase
MITEEREVIEDGFKNGVINILTCTTTLATVFNYLTLGCKFTC